MSNSLFLVCSEGPTEGEALWLRVAFADYANASLPPLIRKYLGLQQNTFLSTQSDQSYNNVRNNTRESAHEVVGHVR